MVELFSRGSDFMNSMMVVRGIPTHVMPCISWFFKYIPKNKYAIFFLFNLQEGLNMLLGAPHWHAPHLIDGPISNLAKTSPDVSHFPSKIKFRGQVDLIVDGPISNLSKSSLDSILGHL